MNIMNIMNMINIQNIINITNSLLSYKNMQKTCIAFAILLFSGIAFSHTTYANAHEKITEENITTQETTENSNIIEKQIPIQIFVNKNCAHCKAEKAFLTKNNISFETLEITENLDFYSEVTEKFNVMGPPLTLAGNTIFQGYDNEKTGQKIIDAYNNSDITYDFHSASEAENFDKIAIYGQKAAICAEDSTECLIPVVENPTFDVPFYGEVEIHTESSALRYTSSFILGFLDGFNPCAMWVLIMFIITLMQVGDRLRMFFVAGTFLLAETIMYALILMAWWKFFNIFSLEYASTLNIVIGIIAVGSGLFFLYEAFFTDGTCQITNQEQQRTISQKISDIANSPISWAAFGGILVLAMSVNVIEFACSAGYPQVFTNMLNAIDGDFSHKMGLLFTYMFAYMLDDILVFGIALYSIEKLGLTQKYARYANIFGGALMVFIGVYMTGLL